MIYIGIIAKNKSIGKNIRIGKNVSINANTLTLGDDVQIEDNCTLSAKCIYIGDGCKIETGFLFRAIKGQAEMLSIGDFSYIGFNTRCFLPHLKIGDYSTVHNTTLINGYRPLNAGHNLWVGQNSILNSTANLTIGNNVGIGPYSQIWTHGTWGELLEGCQLYSIDPIVIEDEVWLVGHCVVSPGVIIGKKSIILVGAVVTKNVAPNSTFGGVPARDMTDKIKPYKELTINQKYKMMKTFVDEFAKSLHDYGGYDLKKIDNGYHLFSNLYDFKIILREQISENFCSDENIDWILITNSQNIEIQSNNISIFDLSTKKYTKRKNICEIEFIRFMNSYRARFLPK